MEAFKKVFSPGHSVDDELMYGSANTKPSTEIPSKSAEQKSNIAPSTADKTATKPPPGTETSNLTPSDRSQAQDNTSAASIKSGVLGHGHDESKLTSEPTSTHAIKDHSKDSVPHHPDTQTKDFDTRADPQSYRDPNSSTHQEFHSSGQAGTYDPPLVTKGENRSRDMEQTPPTAYQQPETTGAYGSYDASRSGNTSSGVDSGTANPTTYQQPENTSSYGAVPDSQGEPTSHGFDSGVTNPTTYDQPDNTSRGKETGFGSVIAPAAAGYALAGDSNKPTNSSRDRYPGAGGEPVGEESRSQPGSRMPGQYPSTDHGSHDNPYSATRLDPRVDPHSNPSNTGSTSVIGTAITTDQNPAEQQRGVYGSSGESRGLSGGKTTAEPFAGPKGTSQPMSDAAAPTEPFTGYKGTSEPLKSENQHETKVGGILAAIGLGKHHSKSETHDAVTQDSPTSSNRKPEPSQAPDSSLGTSDPSTHEDKSHNARKGGILGAIGLGGLAAKKHADEHPEPPAAGSRRESIPTTAYPPGTGLGDRQYPDTPVGGHSGQEGRVAPSTQDAYPHSSQSASQFSPSGTATHAHDTTHTAQPTTKYDTATPHQPEESHFARNAAIGGVAAAGAGVGAIGGYEYSQQRAEKEQQERLEAEQAHQKAMEKSQKAAEKEQKAHDKAVAKEEKKAEKEHEKAVKKEEKEHEKAVVKEEKKAEKEHEKAVKKEEKAAEKQHVIAVKEEEKREKEHEKELAKQEREAEKRTDSDEKEKKHGGILAVFKRRRDSKGNEMEHDNDDQQQGQQQQQHQHVASNTHPTPIIGTAASMTPVHENKPENESETSRISSEEKGKKHGGILGIFKRRRDSKGNEIEREGDDEPQPQPHQHQQGFASNTSPVGVAATGMTLAHNSPPEPETEPHRNSAEDKDKDKKRSSLLGIFKRRRDSKGNELDPEESDRHTPPRDAGPATASTGHHHPSNNNPVQDRAEPTTTSNNDPDLEKDKKHSGGGGILGIFKRRHDSKGNNNSDELVQPEADSSATTGATNGPQHHHHHHPTGADNGNGKHEINKLHKDPPPGLLAASQPQGEEQQPTTGYHPPTAGDGYRGTADATSAPGDGGSGGSIINRPRGAYAVGGGSGGGEGGFLKGEEGTSPVSALSVGEGRRVGGEGETVGGRPYEEMR